MVRERSKELSKIVGSIVLRRQPSILEKSLPPRHEFLIFVKLTDVQTYIYQYNYLFFLKIYILTFFLLFKKKKKLTSKKIEQLSKKKALFRVLVRREQEKFFHL